MSFHLKWFRIDRRGAALEVRDFQVHTWWTPLVALRCPVCLRRFVHVGFRVCKACLDPVAF